MQIISATEKISEEFLKKFLKDARLGERQIASIIKANIKSMSALIDTNINDLRKIKYITNATITRITSHLKDLYSYEVSKEGVIYYA